MGIRVIAAGAARPTNPTGYSIPNIRGITSFFLLGVSTALTIQNLVSGGASASLVGSPIIAASAPLYVGGSLNNYVQTAVSDSPSFTAVWCGRVPVVPTNQANGAYYWGNNTGGTGIGAFAPSSANANGYAFFTPSGGGAAVQKTPQVAITQGASVWQTLMMVVDNTAGLIQMFNLTSGVAGFALTTGGTLVQNPGNAIRIGSTPGASSSLYPAEADIAWLETHNVALSQAEGLAIRAQMLPALAFRGVAG